VVAGNNLVRIDIDTATVGDNWSVQADWGQLTTDPVDPDYSTQTGEVTSRGFEVEGKYQFDNDFELMANYSYKRARVSESNDGTVGFPTAQVPEHLASASVQYPFTGSGFSFDAGVRYLSSRVDYNNLIKVPATTLVDAGLKYEFQGALEGISFNPSASNLFDEVYVASCEGDYWCMWGPRRVVSANVTFKR
jgi:iron complex outermembrane recepter protein